MEDEEHFDLLTVQLAELAELLIAQLVKANFVEEVKLEELKSSFQCNWGYCSYQALDSAS